jgi:hypothetical protein
MRNSRGWPNWSRPTPKPSRKLVGHSPLRSARPCRRSQGISRRVFQAETTTQAERKQLLRLDTLVGAARWGEPPRLDRDPDPLARSAW